MVPTPPLGMETSGRNHRDSGSRDVANCLRGDLLRGGTGVIIAGALLLFLLRSLSQGHVCLRSASRTTQKPTNRTPKNKP